MENRGSGLLLHISCLWSEFGVGDLGPSAYGFIDMLHASKQSYWQVLPLNPTNAVNGNSPYSSVSAFAVNTLFISPQSMLKDELIEKSDLELFSGFSSKRVEYIKVSEAKAKLFDIAYEKFKLADKKTKFNSFCKKNRAWLEDYAAFIVFKKVFDGRLWTQWPKEIRDRAPEALNRLKEAHLDEIKKEQFLQYLFFRQWEALKKYANKKGVQIIGDIPIYVTYDSADVWTNPSIFKLDEEMNLKYLAGVPPDYFSQTGQLWGNPVYDWEVMKQNGYKWWMQRIEHNLKIFDKVRIDHFRGFVDFWQVPAGENTAINGQWQKAPAMDFFNTLLKKYPNAPIIAEDLGIITDEVRETMKYFGFAGMKILLFAFYEDLKKHPYLPHNYTANCVAYTGTHDNNTVRGWFENELKDEDKKKLFTYLGKEVPVDELHWELIEILIQSEANTVIFPVQDILGLPQEDRMNMPGIAENNWQWRVSKDQLNDNILGRLCHLVSNSNRIK